MVRGCCVYLSTNESRSELLTQAHYVTAILRVSSSSLGKATPWEPSSPSNLSISRFVNPFFQMRNMIKRKATRRPVLSSEAATVGVLLLHLCALIPSFPSPSFSFRSLAGETILAAFSDALVDHWARGTSYSCPGRLLGRSGSLVWVLSTLLLPLWHEKDRARSPSKCS